MINEIYVFTTSELPNNVILNHIKVLINRGYDITLVVPDRGFSEKYSSYYNGVKLHRINFRFRNRNLFSYIISLLVYCLMCNYIIIVNKPKNILAIDFEGSLASILSIFYKCKKYALVNDNFAIRYKLPHTLSYLIGIFESAVYCLASIVIIPDFSRSSFIKFLPKSKLRVIPNLISNNHKNTWNPSSIKSVLICGWLDKTRGFDIFFKLVKIFPQLNFIIVGEVKPELMAMILDTGNITYHHHMPHSDMLKIMSMCSVNFAFYDPSILINIYAQPQKIFDSLSMGVPLLVNSEMLIAKELIKNHACLSAPYNDISALVKCIENQLGDFNLHEISRNSLNYYKNSDLSNALNKIEGIYS